MDSEIIDDIQKDITEEEQVPKHKTPSLSKRI